MKIATALTLLSQPSVLRDVLLVVTWLSIVTIVAFAAKAWGHHSPEIVRKVVHIGTGNVILLAWWLQIPAWMGILASVIFSAVTLISYTFPILPIINGVGRKSLGTFFYCLSIGILIGAFWPMGLPYYAVIGILVMTWGDGMAALVGQRWGQHPFKIWGMQKSWEGSCAMAIASYLVTSLILLGVQGPALATWGVSLVIALSATILELYSKRGMDNLTVPLGSGAIAFGLNHLYFGL
ncbi:MAG: phosphatidate cytidylyltransferase [Symploca sp. SIO2B6]|nr:phosphatidate cytidylyltransferase [Symploca sp. SIO2B6]